MFIRPPRASYSLGELGPKLFSIAGRSWEREDFVVKNSRGMSLQCSYWSPVLEERSAAQYPCVVYLHGNCGCRLDALECIELVLSHNICLLTFDFSGSGISDGEFVTLGHNETGDLEVVLSHVRKHTPTRAVALWGVSMGAATSILYSCNTSWPSRSMISCLVLDSPFASLSRVAAEMAEGMRPNIPRWLYGPAASGILQLIRSHVKKRANFDIRSLEPVSAITRCTVPVLLAHANDDHVIPSHHSVEVFERCPSTVPKRLINFDGDHNTLRPPLYFDAISEWLHAHLLSDAERSAVPRPISTVGQYSTLVPDTETWLVKHVASSIGENVPSFGSTYVLLLSATGISLYQPFTCHRAMHLNWHRVVYWNVPSTARSVLILSWKLLCSSTASFPKIALWTLEAPRIVKRINAFMHDVTEATPIRRVPLMKSGTSSTEDSQNLSEGLPIPDGADTGTAASSGTVSPVMLRRPIGSSSATATVALTSSGNRVVVPPHHSVLSRSNNGTAAATAPTLAQDDADVQVEHDDSCISAAVVHTSGASPNTSGQAAVLVSTHNSPTVTSSAAAHMLLFDDEPASTAPLSADNSLVTAPIRMPAASTAATLTHSPQQLSAQSAVSDTANTSAAARASTSARMVLATADTSDSQRFAVSARHRRANSLRPSPSADSTSVAPDSASPTTKTNGSAQMSVPVALSRSPLMPSLPPNSHLAATGDSSATATNNDGHRPVLAAQSGVATATVDGSVQRRTRAATVGGAQDTAATAAVGVAAAAVAGTLSPAAIPAASPHPSSTLMRADAPVVTSVATMGLTDEAAALAPTALTQADDAALPAPSAAIDASRPAVHPSSPLVPRASAVMSATSTTAPISTGTASRAGLADTTVQTPAPAAHSALAGSITSAPAARSAGQASNATPPPDSVLPLSGSQLHMLASSTWQVDTSGSEDIEIAVIAARAAARVLADRDAANADTRKAARYAAEAAAAAAAAAAAVHCSSSSASQISAPSGGAQPATSSSLSGTYDGPVPSMSPNGRSLNRSPPVTKPFRSGSRSQNEPAANNPNARSLPVAPHSGSALLFSTTTSAAGTVSVSPSSSMSSSHQAAMDGRLSSSYNLQAQHSSISPGASLSAHVSALGVVPLRAGRGGELTALADDDSDHSSVGSGSGGVARYRHVSGRHNELLVRRPSAQRSGSAASNKKDKDRSPTDSPRMPPRTSSASLDVNSSASTSHSSQALHLVGAGSATAGGHSPSTMSTSTSDSSSPRKGLMSRFQPQRKRSIPQPVSAGTSSSGATVMEHSRSSDTLQQHRNSATSPLALRNAVDDDLSVNRGGVSQLSTASDAVLLEPSTTAPSSASTSALPTPSPSSLSRVGSRFSLVTRVRSPSSGSNKSSTPPQNGAAHTTTSSLATASASVTPTTASAAMLTASAATPTSNPATPTASAATPTSSTATHPDSTAPQVSSTAMPAASVGTTDTSGNADATDSHRFRASSVSSAHANSSASTSNANSTTSAAAAANITSAASSSRTTLPPHSDQHTADTVLPPVVGHNSTPQSHNSTAQAPGPGAAAARLSPRPPSRLAALAGQPTPHSQPPPSSSLSHSSSSGSLLSRSGPPPNAAASTTSTERHQLHTSQHQQHHHQHQHHLHHKEKHSTTTTAQTVTRKDKKHKKHHSPSSASPSGRSSGSVTPTSMRGSAIASSRCPASRSHIRSESGCTSTTVSGNTSAAVSRSASNTNTQSVIACAAAEVAAQHTTAAAAAAAGGHRDVPATIARTASGAPASFATSTSEVVPYTDSTHTSPRSVPSAFLPTSSPSLHNLPIFVNASHVQVSLSGDDATPGLAASDAALSASVSAAHASSSSVSQNAARSLWGRAATALRLRSSPTAEVTATALYAESKTPCYSASRPPQPESSLYHTVQAYGSFREVMADHSLVSAVSVPDLKESLKAKAAATSGGATSEPIVNAVNGGNASSRLTGLSSHTDSATSVATSTAAAPPALPTDSGSWSPVPSAFGSAHSGAQLDSAARTPTVVALKQQQSSPHASNSPLSSVTAPQPVPQSQYVPHSHSAHHPSSHHHQQPHHHHHHHHSSHAPHAPTSSHAPPSSHAATSSGSSSPSHSHARTPTNSRLVPSTSTGGSGGVAPGSANSSFSSGPHPSSGPRSASSSNPPAVPMSSSPASASRWNAACSQRHPQHLDTGSGSSSLFNSVATYGSTGSGGSGDYSLLHASVLIPRLSAVAVTHPPAAPSTVSSPTPTTTTTTITTSASSSSSTPTTISPALSGNNLCVPTTNVAGGSPPPTETITLVRSRSPSTALGSSGVSSASQSPRPSGSVVTSPARSTRSGRHHAPPAHHTSQGFAQQPASVRQPQVQQPQPQPPSPQQSRLTTASGDGAHSPENAADAELLAPIIGAVPSSSSSGVGYGRVPAQPRSPSPRVLTPSASTTTLTTDGAESVAPSRDSSASSQAVPSSADLGLGLSFSQPTARPAPQPQEVRRFSRASFFFKKKTHE